VNNTVQRKLATGLIAAMCVVGFVGTLDAAPEGSQRLRGLGDRVFAVHVVELTGNLGPWEFDNCYFFEGDGTWIDPGFPAPGSWGQHSTGARTSYSASAEVPELGYRLDQQGDVTPAHGKGTLQIEAISTFFVEGEKFLEFLSVGEEVDTCPY